VYSDIAPDSSHLLSGQVVKEALEPRRVPPPVPVLVGGKCRPVKKLPEIGQELESSSGANTALGII